MWSVPHVLVNPLPFSSFVSLEPETLKSVYAMAFAVEEINRNSTLLQGVKLGYRVLDCCSRYPWALEGALSLVTGNAPSCQSDISVNEQTREEKGITR